MKGSMVRFARTSALDRLADALRRSDATWHDAELFEWDRLPESEQDEWRRMARIAAAEVTNEITAESTP